MGAISHRPSAISQTSHFRARNNRRAEYRECGPPIRGTRRLERTVYYTYRNTGHAAHITINDEPAGGPTAPRIVKDLYLAYGTDEKVGAAIWEEWRYDPQNPGDPQHPTWPWPGPADPFDPDPGDPGETDKVTAAVEFRYESGRQRYLLRYWDTHGWDWKDYWTVGETTWTDYLGGEPYVDYTVATGPVATNQTRWLGGLGIRAREYLWQPEIPVRFMHGDLIGSTMMETGPTGEVVSSGGWGDSLLWQYTAFGEPTWPLAGAQRSIGTRYRYAGQYGYEWGFLHVPGANEDLAAIVLMHVGWRWYQPDIGRFVQRDPIGLVGGLNVYLYCEGDPLGSVDPSGLADWSWRGFITAVIAGAVGGAATAKVCGAPGVGLGAVGGGVGTGVYYTCECIADTGGEAYEALREAGELNRRSQRTRQKHPEIWPPPPPPPPDCPRCEYQ